MSTAPQKFGSALRAAALPVKAGQRQAYAPSDAKRLSGAPLEYLSASRLKTWQECRLKFFFHYVERIPTPTSPALFVGQIVHRVLQRWNLARWRGQPADADSLQPVFDHHWKADQPADGIDWNGKEAALREKAWQMLEFYFRSSPIPLAEKPEAVEVVVERDLDLHGLPPLRGVIDLVREGGVIVDFKTTARTPDPAMTRHQHATQLGCYALLYREATGHPESGFELHHLVKTKEPKLVVTPLEPLDADQMRGLVRSMESYVLGVEAGDYVPSPGMQCAWCDYFAQCRAWKGGES